jgi:hypothetical protein
MRRGLRLHVHTGDGRTERKGNDEKAAMAEISYSGKGVRRLANRRSGEEVVAAGNGMGLGLGYLCGKCPIRPLAWARWAPPQTVGLAGLSHAGIFPACRVGLLGWWPMPGTGTLTSGLGPSQKPVLSGGHRASGQMNIYSLTARKHNLLS